MKKSQLSCENSIVCNILCLVDCTTTSNGDDGFCYCNTCSENEGDCDNHDECQSGLACGSNNCPASLNFDSEFDCCYNEQGCFDLGNYVGNNIDYIHSINNTGDCQDECQKHLDCRFWTYNYETKNCWRHIVNAPENIGTCNTCIRGPRNCISK